MKYQKIQTDVLSVALLLGFFFFFFLFATAMPKEGATKANRLRMHNEQQHERLRTTLEFYITEQTK